MTHRNQSGLTLSGHLKTSASRNVVALAAMFAAPMLALSASPVHGQSICTETSPGSGVFDCSGTSGDTQVLTATGVPAGITLDDTVTVDTTVPGGSGGDAFAVNGSNGVTVIQAADGRDLTGETSGVSARNAMGALSLTVTGTATGADQFGIYAINAGTLGTDLSITAADTNGGRFGIRSVNFGTGPLTITSTGTASGTSWDGIYALNSSNELSITANDSIGGEHGIRSGHYGAGSHTIISTGTATGTGRFGIHAFNSSSTSTDLSITAVDTNGGYSGIVASNAGTGSLVVTSSGTATGTTYDGINAFNSSGTDLSIVAASTSGGRYGIRAINNGSGSLSITSTGTAIGTTADGIYANNAGTDLSIEAADTNGKYSGIFATNDGTGSLAIASTGMATGAAYAGILAINESTGADLSITAADTSGNWYGIYARNSGAGSLTVTSTGTATAINGDGIRAHNSSAGTGLSIEAADTSGGGYGIRARHDGTGALTIATTGTATGMSQAGIYARNDRSATSLMIVVGDDVTGGDDGIVARNYGSGGLTLDVAGDVTGQAGDGIRARNVGAGSLAITSSGTITGTGDNGIYAVNSRFSADFSLTAADTTGGTTGINARNEGTGSLTITSTGAATGTGRAGIRASGSGTDLSIDAVDTSGAFYGISTLNSGSGSLTITSTGTATGTGHTGIQATNSATGTDLLVTAADTSGDRYGIDARNSGSGSLTVTSTGTAASASGTGISARNTGTGSDLTIVASEVTGGSDGIDAHNEGTGSLSITSAGTVTGTDFVGIRAYNSSAGASLAIVASDAVTGGHGGIQARNYGTAGLTIQVGGDVTSQEGDGIDTFNSANDVSASTSIYQAAGTTTTGALHGITADNAGGSLTIAAFGITIGEAGNGIYAVNQATATDLSITSDVASGGQSGIRALNSGAGSLTITSTASAAGTNGYGIDALNGSDGSDLAIEAVDTTGGRYGIRASNGGAGSLAITSTGIAEGTAYYGIYAFNSSAGTDLSIAAVEASGGEYGIRALNFGTGSLVITSTGTALGTDGAGISARNTAAGTDISITAVDTSGELGGISVLNSGTSSLTIISTGTAAGSHGDGIFARSNNAAGADVAIAAADTRGGYNGIRARNDGTGSLSVTSTGTTLGTTYNGIYARNSGTDLVIDAQGDVIGGADAIHADNQGSGTVTITTSGTVNGGEDGIDASSSGGAIVIANSDTLNTGTGYAVVTSGGPTSLTNTGTINGRVMLGGLDDTLINAGLFNAAPSSDFGAGTDLFENNGTVRVAGVVTFAGLERFVNNDLVTMIDGATNDSLILAGDYEANSDLAIDVRFDGTGSADTLVVGGAATGITAIVVNDISTSADFGHAILLVDAAAGTAADAFALDPSFPTASGFLAYDLFFDAPADDFYLSSTIGSPVFQALKFAEGAQSLWYRSADAVAAQMTSRRDASGSPLWLQIYGASANRDESFDFTSAGFTQSISLDYGQDYFGFQAGYEFGPGVESDGAVFGVTGGYLNSTLGLDGVADRAEYDVFNIGAYAGIKAGGFFADALLKYDFIDTSVVAPTPGYTAELDGKAYGARLQAGYRWGSEGFFAEPAVSIEYQRTSLDDFSALGATIDYDRFEGLRGMAGLRLGGRSEIGGRNTMTYYLGGRAVHEFRGDNGLVFTSDTSSIAIANNPLDTFGRFELGVNIATPGNVTGFIEGNADIGSGYNSYGGRAGLRIRF